MVPTDRFNRVVKLVQAVVSPYMAVPDATLRTVYLRGPAEVVTTAETILKKYDTVAVEERQRQIQLTVYIVAPAEEAASGRNFPPDLAAATEQLRNTFGFKAFHLVDTVLMRSKESGNFSTKGLLPIETQAHQPVAYEAEYRNVMYSEAQKSLIVSQFRFFARIP